MVKNHHHSVRQGLCENEKCSYTHLKGTKRNKKSTVNNNPGRYPQTNANQQGNSSNFDQRYLGFLSYPAQKRAARAPNNGHYQHQNHTNSNPHEEFRYQDDDFPFMESTRRNVQHTQKTVDQSNQPNKAQHDSSQDFLDSLKKVVKEVQESQAQFQKKFQGELQTIKEMLTHQIPQQQYLQYNQAQALQHQPQNYPTQAHHHFLQSQPPAI